MPQSVIEARMTMSGVYALIGNKSVPEPYSCTYTARLSHIVKSNHAIFMSMNNIFVRRECNHFFFSF